MKRDGLQRIMESQELTQGEKEYIFDWQYHMGGSFSQALWLAISKADGHNIELLRLGFPAQVQGYEAWSQGDLYQRASKIAGGDVGFIQDEKEQEAQP